MELSVVISAYNEEKMLEDCLQSVKDLADEIVVVDNSSTDDTAKVAKRFTKNVFTQKNDPTSIDTQKNFGFSKATGDWILSLDADERVTPELIKEIKEKIGNWKLEIGNSDVVGYWIPRKNILFGKWIEHTGWYPDEQLRLFRKGKGEYKIKHVHEDLVVDGEVDHLSEHILHENYQTISQFVERNLLRYAPNEAESLVAKGYTFSYIDALWFPVREFLSRYFAREGYKDGLHGLVLSLLLAAYHLVIFAYIWEKKNFPEEKELFSISHVRHESEKIAEEFQYWFETEAIKNTKNPLKKVLLKTKRKLTSS